jgi:DNA-directed RNA polymerase specialized sigma24 family protein
MATNAMLERPSPDLVEEPQELSHVAFTRLLDWLDNGVDSHGERYVEMRRRLTAYFDRRNRPLADELADETLNRIGRTLQRDGVITVTPQERYCYVVAKFVLLEDVRREQRHVREDMSLPSDPESWKGHRTSLTPNDTAAYSEARLAGLDRCLDSLEPDVRTIILDYYRDAGRERIARRREMARALGITMNALGIRVCRIRAALEARMAMYGSRRDVTGG